jgi:bifunctional non-homologous end joining protein LigD
MLATPGLTPVGDEWAAEVKWDGMRAQVRFDGRRLCVRSRPGRDCSEEFPELVALADALSLRRVVLDGELVCLAVDGKPDFAALRRRLVARGTAASARAAAQSPATLMVFDVLHLDGRAVRELPYAGRRELLAELALDGPAWRTPGHFLGRGADLATATAAQGLEGIVSKRVDAPWLVGRRSASWVKTKHRRRETVLITGWREPADQPVEFLVARRGADGELSPAGAVARGLGAEQRAELIDVLAAVEQPRRRRNGVRWTAAPVEATVECHGRLDGPVRDAVLREVLG